MKHKKGKELWAVILGGLIIVIFTILLWAILGPMNIPKTISDVFKNNFGEYTANILIQNFTNGIFLMVYLSIILSGAGLIMYGLNKKRKNCFFITVIICLGAIWVGFFSINAVIGYNPIDAILRDQNGANIGAIECYNQYEDKVILVGDSIGFKITGNLRFNAILFSYTYKNQSTDIQLRSETSGDNIRARSDVEQVYIELVQPKINDTESERVSTTFRYNFPTKEEYKRSQSIFISAILGLLLLIFLTIPSAILKWKELWDK